MTQPEFNGLLNHYQAQAAAVYGAMDAGIPEEVIRPVREHIANGLRDTAEQFANTTDVGQGRDA